MTARSGTLEKGPCGVATCSQQSQQTELRPFVPQRPPWDRPSQTLHSTEPSSWACQPPGCKLPMPGAQGTKTAACVSAWACPRCGEATGWCLCVLTPLAQPPLGLPARGSRAFARGKSGLCGQGEVCSARLNSHLKPVPQLAGLGGAWVWGGPPCPLHSQRSCLPHPCRGSAPDSTRGF